MPSDCSANTNQDATPHVDTQSRPLGNSERIRLKFGSYGIEILENSRGLRVSSLYSTHDGERINRTFAVVAYPDVIDPAFVTEHQAIMAGQSIGIVFEDNGWLIDKHHQYFGAIDTPPGYFKVAADQTGITRAAIHVYTLVVKKGPAVFEYATIAEIHHPEFLQLQDLAAIYGPEFDSHLERKDKIGGFLAVIESRIMAL